MHLKNLLFCLPVTMALTTVGAHVALVERDIQARHDFPGLYCGYARALSCMGSISTSLVLCIAAAIAGGLDWEEDTLCGTLSMETIGEWPTSCKLCFGL
jgi:hypothetical protein